MCKFGGKETRIGEKEMVLVNRKSVLPVSGGGRISGVTFKVATISKFFDTFRPLEGMVKIGEGDGIVEGHDR